MLQIQHISKQYRTGALVQLALNDVSLNLRDNEFISILGPSGSGKTTLLNIIGGLDRYDYGDLIINDISTKKYKAKDWDAYRNHVIGFVFQSYNLIPHQSILANVELALTIGGVSGKERRRRAKEALKEVGLEEHLHKKPNQLSGGQMQRVAIARALVNDPKILLADEPTGALDTETGIQVMEILKKVAEKRLVVMVTHNPELAEKYSSRIVKLLDGRIVDDTNPYIIEEKTESTEKNKTEKFSKSKMSFLTSLSLSFNNLKTKLGRTVITSCAGSIGIIGIAVILALSNSVNSYITKLQRDTIESYPITITAETYVWEDNKDLFSDDVSDTDDQTTTVEGKITASVSNTADDMYNTTPTKKTNNLGAFKSYLEDPKNGADEYIGTGAIISDYDTKFHAYTKDLDGNIINTSNYLNNDGSFSGLYDQYSATGFTELPKGRDNATISKKTKDSYKLIYGNWPENMDECVIVTDVNGTIDINVLCRLGFISVDDFLKMTKDPSLANSAKLGAISYKDICSKRFTVLPSSYRYEKTSNGTYKYIEDTSEQIKTLLDQYGIELKVTGILRPLEESSSSNDLMGMSSTEDTTVGYTYKLTNKIIDTTANAEVIKAQTADKSTSVLTGLKFDEDNESVKAENYKKIFSTLDNNKKIQLYANYLNSGGATAAIGTENANSSAPSASMFNELLDTIPNKQLIELYENYNYIPENYEDTLYEIGYVSYDEPTSITIYTDTFEGKQGIMKLMDEYNDTADEKDAITYYDFIKEFTDQIMSIISTISYVLIAFVAVSLIVSCIMIGIITHISVLERTKEIGILRALGATKRNISQVFNAETFIIGLLSGIIGIVFASLLCIPANIIIDQLNLVTDGDFIISVPVIPAMILIFISTFITMLGGFVPALTAAKKDPVVALRTE